MKKVSNLSFIILILLVMLVGLGKTVFFPKDVNLYENRKAEKIKTPTATDIADGTFQDSVEDALADQIFLAQTTKKIYNDSTSAYLNTMLKPLLQQSDNYYVSYDKKNGLYLFGKDQLVNKPIDPEESMKKIKLRAENINSAIAANPNTEFFCYYVECDDNIDFTTNEKNSFNEYLFGQLSLNKEHCGTFEINSYQDYRNYFYKSDHHWNHIGSYNGYLNLLKFLKIEDAPIETKGEFLLGKFVGATSRTAGTTEISDEMRAYYIDLPEMEYYSYGNKRADYGHAKAYQENGIADPSYGTYYGEDCGELIIKNNRKDRPNILIIGDSFDNAVLSLLATHYNTTYSIDLRYYEPIMKKPFELSKYIQEHDIDQVLLIGSPAYYQLDSFNLEG